MPTKYLKGPLGRFGWKKATTWGTAVAIGAGNGIRILKEGVGREVENLPDESCMGSMASRVADDGVIKSSGAISFYGQYEGLESIVAQCFGTAGAPTTVDTSAKKHVFKINADQQGIFGTGAFDKVLTCDEMTTAKVKKVTIKGEASKRVEVDVEFLVYDVTASSATNTLVTMASMTYPTPLEYIKTSQLVARINSQSGGALGSGDKVYVRGFEITLERNLIGDDYSTKHGRYIEEPIDDGKVKVTGKLDFRKYSDETGSCSALVTGLMARSRFKMDMTFTGTTLVGAATQYNQMLLYIPDLKFMGGDIPHIDGGGVAQWSGSFEAYGVASIPTGFPTGYTDPLTAEFINTLATDPLA